MDDEPERAKRRRMPDAYAKELLGRLLHYREIAEADPMQAEVWRGRALHEARELVKGLTAWAAGWTPPKPPADPARRRLWISRHLGDAPHMPPWASTELRQALAALDHGQVEPLLAPNPTRKRAKKPMEQAEAKWRLLAHVEWLAGQGVKMHEAKDRVAKAIGRAPENLDQWRYVEAEPPEKWRRLTLVARAAGEHLAAGLPYEDPSWERIDGDGRGMRDLGALAAAYQKATHGT